MISYKGLFDMAKANKMTEKQLWHKLDFSTNLVYKIKKGQSISLKTIDRICTFFNCQPSDVIYFVGDE